jgi:hypothetical protein
MIIGIEGGLGSGKTLLMTRYLKKDYDKGRKVYANYGLRNMEYEKVDMNKLIRNELDLQNASVGIDEFTLYADSRSSMGNKLISYFVLQTRKTHVCLYYTTQNIQMVDRRVREHTQVFIYCKDVGREGYRLYQTLDYRFGKYAHPQTFLMPIQPWFKYFDTDERLSPVVKT